jgi:hypothetical protein
VLVNLGPDSTSAVVVLAACSSQVGGALLRLSQGGWLMRVVELGPGSTSDWRSLPRRFGEGVGLIMDRCCTVSRWLLPYYGSHHSIRHNVHRAAKRALWY